MFKNALVALMRSTLLPLLTAQGLGTYPLKQSAQPTQQGRPKNSFIYFQTIGNSRLVGWPKRFNEFNVLADRYEQGTRQQLETTFQFGALVNVDPADEVAATAGDVLRIVALILSSDMFLTPMRAQNVGMLRITDIRGEVGISDRAQFQSEPSFDVTFTHVSQIVFVQNEVTAAEYQLYRV